jgi:RimJ/RimL family protein N-acetyltransferase
MQARPPIALAEQERRYEAWATDPDSAWFTIYARDGSRPIGIVRLGTLDFRSRSTGFGITIGESDARSRGYGTEATVLTLDYAFTALGLHSVSLGVAAFNAAGIRAYTKAGFKESGWRRECWWLAGRWWDEVLMDCLASEFASPVLAGIFRRDEPREL